MTEDQLIEAFWEEDGLATQIYEYLKGHLDTKEVIVSVSGGCRRVWDVIDD